jgi:predicted hydrocarbon binding protein
MRKAMNEYGQPETLLKLVSNSLNAILDGLKLIGDEDRDKIMRLCGEACAKEKMWGSSVEIVDKISREEKEIDKIIKRLNNEISWCGEWIRNGKIISSNCSVCGCPLVRHKIIKNTDIFCYCSKGWIETIFGTLLKKPVESKLVKTIGRGDSECRFEVQLGGNN